MNLTLNQGRLTRSGLAFLAMLCLLSPFSKRLDAAPQSFSKRFSKGDALRLTIWQPWQIGEKKNQGVDFNGDYLIDNRGFVFFPLIGDVKVVSHSAKTLAADLTEKFSAYIQDPIIIVEPLIRVALLGAFRRPGTYLIPPNASLWALVDVAGGPDDDSNLQKVYIERAGRTVKKNMLSGFERAYTLQELGVRTGDQIILPQKNRFKMKDAFDILRFAINILNLYVIITRI